MSDDGELSISELRRKRAQSAGSAATPAGASPAREASRVEPAIITTVRPPANPLTRPALHPQQPQPPEPQVAEKAKLPFDLWRLPKALRQRWHWLACSTCLLGLLSGAVGFWQANYSIHVPLTLRDMSSRIVSGEQEGVSFKPPEISSQALVSFLTSPDLLSYVGSQATPPISARQLLASLSIHPEKNSETLEVTITGKDPQALVALANLYTAAAVTRSKEAEQENPGLMFTNFTKQLAGIERQQTDLNQQLASFRHQSGVTDPAVENPAFEKEWVNLRVKIDIARGQLDLLGTKEQLALTEPVQKRLQEANTQLALFQSQGKKNEHPDVLRLREEIAELNQQLAAPGDGSKPADGFYAPQAAATAARKKTLELEIDQLENQAAAVKGKLDKLYANTGEYNQIKTGLDRLENYKKNLNARRFEAQQYRDNAEGYYKPPATPALLKDVDSGTRYHTAAGFTLVGGLAGCLGAMMLVLLTEVIDPRLKTAADVKRVTQLPVLATLGDLDQMDEGARKAWAFRTWTILSGTLSPSANRGTVCGFISCARGEGRSTWVELLVAAAKERGFAVTKLDFGRLPADPPLPQSTAPETSGEPGSPSPQAGDSTATNPSALVLTDKNQKLAQAGAASVIHVELPGLVWNLERRIQFQTELEECLAASHAVILVDLPPASVPEAILLAENLPQLIWLVDSGRSHARETRLHLETLRHARCKLVGAVVNHEPEPLIKL
jgi:capsular polysaccharide biosynthesis protein